MKKTIVLFALITSSIFYSQSKGMRIGYIDMDYILSKVSSYAEANNQLELKAVKWKQEIETKKNEINALKDELQTERALLTKELIEEREEEISYLEQELLDYQEKRFGVQGDLIIQKTTLIKPVQDQVFNAIQDIAERGRYDFVFDKSSDKSMLFVNQRNDLSDKVLRIISRAEKREELTKKQLKAQEAREYQENLEDENPELAARRKRIEEKKAAREKMLEERRLAREKLFADRKAEAEARREETQKKREALKNGTEIDFTDEGGEKVKSSAADKREAAKEEAAAKRADAAAKRERKLEERKQALKERREAAQKAREAAIKTREEAKKEKNSEEENEEEK